MIFLFEISVLDLVFLILCTTLIWCSSQWCTLISFIGLKVFYMFAKLRKLSCLSVEGESRSDGSFFALPLAAASAAVNFSPWTKAEVSFHGALITSHPLPAVVSLQILP